MSTRSDSACSAPRATGNINSATVACYVAYLDKRAAFAAGIHSPTLAAPHTGRAPLWDRQAALFAEVSQ